ncbi:MAG: hypothetical protein H0T45_03265, partial [Pyrinomonadaceae bacterium]|nr:hypothetical protein [Pyrinomonadaceae bacterium]
FWGSERFREAHAGGQADDAHAQAYDKGHAPHDAVTLSVADDTLHAPGGGHHGHDDTTTAHDDTHHHVGPFTPHESPAVMTIPLVVLAVLSTFGGLIGVPYALSGGTLPNFFEHALDPVVSVAPRRGEAAAHGAPAAAPSHGASEATHGGESPATLSPVPQSHNEAAPATVGEGTHGPGAAAAAAEHAHDPHEIMLERIFSGLSVAIALVGIGIGWFVFRRNPLLAPPRLLENKYYVDEFYDAAIINPIKVGSREGLWKIFDIGVIDGLVNGLARGMSELGTLARRLQPGFVRSYAAMILLGALAVIGYFAFEFRHMIR